MKLDLIGGMVSNGWPSDKSIYEFAAYEILKFGTENKGKYQEGVSNFEQKALAIVSGGETSDELAITKQNPRSIALGRENGSEEEGKAEEQSPNKSKRGRNRTTLKSHTEKQGSSKVAPV